MLAIMIVVITVITVTWVGWLTFCHCLHWRDGERVCPETSIARVTHKAARSNDYSQGWMCYNWGVVIAPVCFPRPITFSLTSVWSENRDFLIHGYICIMQYIHSVLLDARSCSMCWWYSSEKNGGDSCPHRFFSGRKTINKSLFNVIGSVSVIKQCKEDRGWHSGRGYWNYAVLVGMGSEGLSEKVAFELRPKWKMGGMRAAICEKSLPGRGSLTSNVGGS